MESKYPSPEQARELFELRDGELYWKPRTGPDSKRFNTRYAGKLAGRTSPAGYKVLTWNKRTMLMQHRIIFAMEHGYYPPMVDHKNRDKSLNKDGNLRPANRQLNSANRPGFGKYAKGVTYQGGCRKPWYAAIRIDRKLKHLGTFYTEQEAAKAYQVAAKAAFGEFSCFEKGEVASS